MADTRKKTRKTTKSRSKRPTLRQRRSTVRRRPTLRQRRSTTRRRHTTRKTLPWAGWSRIAPTTHQRTVMMRDCGKKCFLGPNKSFPICAAGTCDISKKGLWAAYIRAKQWGKKSSTYKGKARPTHQQKIYKDIARKSKKMLSHTRKSRK